MKTNSPASVAQLIADYHQRTSGITFTTDRLEFTGVGDKDVYNITAPFTSAGLQVIAGRVEARDSEHSTIVFFQEQQGKWTPVENAPTFPLQDPFFCFIAGELIFGGVEINPHPEHPGQLIWHTVFYRGRDILSLNRFACGPSGMKDIRLCQIQPGRIGVFTRPQGNIGGRGTIGYVEISYLEELTPDTIANAQLLDRQFNSDEWGGVNETHLLSDGTIGLLAHIACFDQQQRRHYYPGVFIFNPDTKNYSPIKIIAARSNLLPGDAKRPDLVDVIFPGGLIALADNRWRLYVGASDAQAHWIDIEDPFIGI
ncbi:MTP-1 family protein [Serratia fonticola]